MGVTRTNGIPGLPGNNNFKVMYTGAKRLGYKKVHTGRMAINSEPRHDRPSCQQIGFCFQGCKSLGQVVARSTPRSRRRSTPASSSCGPSAKSCRSSTTRPARSRACSTPTRTASSTSQKARVVAVAGNSIESPRLLLELGLGQVPGRARQQLGPGRPELHAPPHRLGLRRRSTSPCTCSAAPPWPASSRTRPATTRAAASSAATSWRPCRSACRSWRRSSTPAPGAASSRARWRPTRTWPACGSSARTCRARPTG